MILLTDEEVKTVLDDASLGYNAIPNNRDKVVAKAQLKKIVEWGNEICPHPSTFDGQRRTKKRHCPECWQALLKEVE